MKKFKTNEDCLKIKSYILESKKYWRIEMRGMEGGFFPAFYKKKNKAIEVKTYFLLLIQSGYYITSSSIDEHRLIIRKLQFELISHDEDTYIFSIYKDGEKRTYISWIQDYIDSNNSQNGFRHFGLLKINDISICEISKERLTYIAKRDPILTGGKHLFSSYITESLL